MDDVHCSHGTCSNNRRISILTLMLVHPPLSLFLSTDHRHCWTSTRLDLCDSLNSGKLHTLDSFAVQSWRRQRWPRYHFHNLLQMLEWSCVIRLGQRYKNWTEVMKAIIVRTIRSHKQHRQTDEFSHKSSPPSHFPRSKHSHPNLI